MPLSTLHDHLTRLEMRYKKSRIATERCEVKRAAFVQALEHIEPHRLVFLDECAFSLNLHRLYGWVRGGERCTEAVPFNKGLNHSVLGALSLPSAANPTGMWALWQKLGAWTRETFEAFLSEGLLPRLSEGSVLVLDNARIHSSQIVEKAGCSLLYLPPYSPDFNPIEPAWS